MYRDASDATGMVFSYTICLNCGGHGKSEAASCPRCAGSGLVGAQIDESLIEVALPVYAGGTFDIALPRNLE